MKKIQTPIFRIVLLMFVCLIGGMPVLGGVTYYVAKNGDDGNPCTAVDAPCATIQQAASLALNPGDIVQVGEGVYRERLRIQRGGSEEEPLVFRGHSGEGCPVETIEGDPNSRGKRPTPVVEMDGFRIEASHVRFECFRVVGTDLPTAELNSGFAVRRGVRNVVIEDNVVDGKERPGRPWAAVSLQSSVPLESMASHVRVSRNYIRQTGFGFMIFCKEQCLFEDNEVERTTADANVGDSDYSRVFGEYVTLRGNYFHGNRAADCPRCHFDCFQTYNTGIGAVDHLARHILIEGNTCMEAHQGIIARDGTAKTEKFGTFETHTDWVVRNNIFAFGPVGGSRMSMSWCAMFEHIGDVVFEHNLCYQTGVTGYLNATTGIHQYNIHYESGFLPYTAVLSGYLNGRVTGGGNLLFRGSRSYVAAQWPSNEVLNVEPMFENAENRDFRLRGQSPARNRAMGSLVERDRSGLRRPHDGVSEIGPYEYPGAEPPEKDPVAKRNYERSRQARLQVVRSLPLPVRGAAPVPTVRPAPSVDSWRRITPRKAQ